MANVINPVIHMTNVINPVIHMTNVINPVIHMANAVGKWIMSLASQYLLLVLYIDGRKVRYCCRVKY